MNSYILSKSLSAIPSCRLFQKAYREDSARLCQLLAEKNNIVDYWIFLSTCCETDMLVDFAKRFSASLLTLERTLKRSCCQFVLCSFLCTQRSHNAKSLSAILLTAAIIASLHFSSIPDVRFNKILAHS